MIGNKKLAGMLLSLIVLAIFAVPANAAEMPQITITEPKNGSSIPAGNVTVSVDVQNFNLAEKLGEANVAGEGHIHYFMDVAAPTTPGKPAITTVGTYAPTAKTSFTWANVTPGMHNFSVELINNDHTPLVPPVVSEVNVTVAALKTMSAQSDPQSVTIGLVAKNIAFNTSTITVPAGADVTVNFDNQDANTPHNFAVYTDSSATTAIFQGKIITGPAKTTYTFKAPNKPGTYFFRCDVHPTIMKGQFIVE